MFFALVPRMVCFETGKFSTRPCTIRRPETGRRSLSRETTTGLGLNNMKRTLMMPMMISLWVLTASLAADQAAAQEYVELRSAVSRAGAVYRYLGYNRVFHNKVTLDAYYIGVPGQDELYLGLGYQLQATKSLTVTPLFYGVIGKERAERGLAMGAVVNGSVKALNVSGYVCHFEPMGGSVARYTFLDSLDISKKVKQWEIGGSTGFVHADGNWNPLVGPVIIRSDERGSWKVHVRGGSTFEARLTRTLTF